MRGPMFPLALTLLLLPVLAGAPMTTAARAAVQAPEETLAAASALFDAGRYAEAARKLDAFLDAHPKHSRAGAAALALGRSRAEQKQWAQAVPAYEKAVASKDPSVVPVARVALGEAAVRAGQWAKAAAALGEAVKGALPPEQAPFAWFWLGRAHEELGRSDAAEAAFLRVTRDYAGSEVAPDARFGAAVAALRRGNADAAARRLRALADEAPANLHRPQALLLLARLDLDAKRYDAARRGFEDLLDGPGAADAGAQTRRQAETGLIDTLLALGEDDAAASRLTALLSGLPAGDPQRYRAQLTLGHCRYRQKAYEAALSAYREAARSPDTSVAAEGDYWAGNAALALNRPADAAARFQQVVARSPQSAIAPRAALKAAEARTAAKQHREAAAAYRAVVQKYPGSKEADAARAALAGLLDAVNDPVALAAAVNGAAATPDERIRGRLRLARLHVAAKRYPAAVTLLEAALRGTPRPAGARAAEANYLLGLAREGQGKAAPAAAAFSAAVEKAPPSAPWLDDARSRMAWLYLDLKQPARAQAAAEAVLARRGSAADTAGGEDVTAAASVSQARLALLQAYLDQKRWDAALGVCDALTAAADPAPETEATVLFTRAWVREQQGRPDEARALWERLAAEHGRSRYAAEALVRLGDADLKAKRYDAARERYAAAVTDHPQSPLRAEARFKLGSALYHLDRFPEAAREFDGVVATAGANDYLPEALYWAGLALDKAGDKRGAIERLSRLVRRFPKHGRVAGARVRLAALKAVA